jgi:hypothetical protein
MMPPQPVGSRRSKKCCAELAAAAGATDAEAMPDDRVKRLTAARRVRSRHRMSTQLASSAKCWAISQRWPASSDRHQRAMALVARRRFYKEACCKQSRLHHKSRWQLWVNGGCRRQADGTAGLSSAAELPVFAPAVTLGATSGP